MEIVTNITDGNDEYREAYLKTSQIKDIREKVIDVLRSELPKETVEFIFDEVKTRLRNTPIL